MKTNDSTHRGLLAVGFALLVSLMAVSTTALAQGNKEGIDIKIRAQNRAVSDRPAFCPGEEGSEGSEGDSLKVDVWTDETGAAFGTAEFTAADGTVTLMDVDRVFAFFGGLAVQDSNTGNTVAIWFNNIEESGPTVAPAHVNVELPRGCGNTVSTFTVNVDKVTMQIKFQ